MVAEFIIGAARPELFPAESLPEVAFLGRSNVGKSSLINCLVNKKELARTSATPGCTQAIQFYRVDGRWHFVDLPGYGYAKVSRDKSQAWKNLIEHYLTRRKSLELCLLLLDSRRGWMEMDLELRDWLEHWGLPYVVIATKVDKLKTQRERIQCLAALQEPDPGLAVLTFSAVTGQGVREIWQVISKTKTRA
ncbi:MAG: ribosome biogenesis GTP-binding protein YihA/YsxC [Bryobacteraceae bacterium]|nr:ribosome biogenesis GTP-binding protein YihA/YsxC [Bryobacteraceae bacterium]MDW8380035.1 ribosome biogenesis GTP-binding protein YihA/YsxC [Bryobacterales bacterium]